MTEFGTPPGERIARLEASYYHVNAWVGTIARAQEAHDDRIRKIGARAGQAIDRITAAEREIERTRGELSEMRRTAARRRRDVIQWTMTALLPLAVIAAGAAGYVPKESVDQTLAHIKGLQK